MRLRTVALLALIVMCLGVVAGLLTHSYAAAGWATGCWLFACATLLLGPRT